jgi:hypothetical protein
MEAVLYVVAIFLILHLQHQRVNYFYDSSGKTIECHRFGSLNIYKEPIESVYTIL